MTERARRHLIRDGRAAFRRFRRTRPFWASIWTFLGGFIIFEIPLTSIGRIVKTGLPGVGGTAIGVLLMLMAIFLLVSPAQRFIVAVVAAILALASFPISNLGGFFFGMFFALVGASMAFGWMPEKPQKKYRRFRRIQQPTPDVDESDPTSVALGAGVEPTFMAQTAR